MKSDKMEKLRLTVNLLLLILAPLWVGFFMWIYFTKGILENPTTEIKALKLRYFWE